MAMGRPKGSKNRRPKPPLTPAQLENVRAAARRRASVMTEDQRVAAYGRRRQLHAYYATHVSPNAGRVMSAVARATMSRRQRERFAAMPLAERRRVALKPYAAIPWEQLSPNQKRSRVLCEQEWKCNWCGLGEWRGRPIALEYEHRDGNRQKNNARENVEALCPNCHAQTSTWKRAKNPRGATVLSILRMQKQVLSA